MVDIQNLHEGYAGWVVAPTIETPCEACGGAGGVGVLRLRDVLRVREAHPPLRMTDDEKSCFSLLRESCIHIGFGNLWIGARCEITPWCRLASLFFVLSNLFAAPQDKDADKKAVAPLAAE